MSEAIQKIRNQILAHLPDFAEYGLSQLLDTLEYTVTREIHEFVTQKIKESGDTFDERQAKLVSLWVVGQDVLPAEVFLKDRENISLVATESTEGLVEVTREAVPNPFLMHDPEMIVVQTKTVEGEDTDFDRWRKKGEEAHPLQQAARKVVEAERARARTKVGILEKMVGKEIAICPKMHLDEDDIAGTLLSVFDDCIELGGDGVSYYFDLAQIASFRLIEEDDEDIPAPTPAPAPIRLLERQLRGDKSYAHSWHCNVAVACQNAIDAAKETDTAHAIANDAASRVMWTAFGVTTSNDMLDSKEDDND